MSYPRIGMEGMGYDNYGPATIEQMLREGVRIYEDDGDGVSYFDKDSGFMFEAWDSGISDPVKRHEARLVKKFETYLELTSWLAFWGKDFL